MPTPDVLQIGPWQAELKTGRLTRPGEVRDVEPKVMDLLFLLSARRGEVLSREEILAALWPSTTVGEDALSRTVFKLRRALDDDPKQPRYVETLPKRGYRLLPDTATPLRRKWPLWPLVAATILAIAAIGFLTWRAMPISSSEITRRADDAYFQYRRTDNESAALLYERALAANPHDALALAGLANTLVQRVVRWPQGAKSPLVAPMDIRTALADGRTRTPAAIQTLQRARGLAEYAVRIAPRDPTALRSLGLALSAQGRLDEAREVYERARDIDPGAWGVLINLAEIYDLTGRPDQATDSLERAYDAMSYDYDRQSARIRPWHAALGVRIAERLTAAGKGDEARDWYRRVLNEAPLDPAATRGLARLLRASGEADAARRLCDGLAAGAGPQPGC